jgi:NAD-dependent deacetylase
MTGTQHRYDDEAGVARLGRALEDAERVLVLTGAGVSRASGLPTYRGEGGIYADRDIEALHHADQLPDSLPALWGFWGPRRATISAAQPNAAHRAIADLQRHGPAVGRSVTLATQNVDDLHERGGSPQVAHLHGSLFRTRCYERGCAYGVRDDDTPYAEPPVCPECGSWLRPAVVLFGEPLDVDADMTARRAVRDCHLLVAVGTSGEVSTAAMLIRYAADIGAVLVSVDPAPEVAPVFDVHVALPAEVALPRLFAVRP